MYKRQGWWWWWRSVALQSVLHRSSNSGLRLYVPYHLSSCSLAHMRGTWWASCCLAVPLEHVWTDCLRLLTACFFFFLCFYPLAVACDQSVTRLTNAFRRPSYQILYSFSLALTSDRVTSFFLLCNSCYVYLFVFCISIFLYKYLRCKYNIDQNNS